jgi:predicted Zn-dependent protease
MLIALMAMLLATACATSPGGRTQITPPVGFEGFSAVYSEIDMQLQLITAADAPGCHEADCLADRDFEQRVLAVGGRLADVAFRQHPDLHLRFPRFEIVVADKRDPGSASSAAGTVVIFRGTRNITQEEGALAFVLAREMSHVIGGHHDENVATSILVGVAAQVLFPFLNIPALFSTGAAATTAATSAATATVTSTFANTAVASAASFAGSRALRASYRDQHVLEAEIMAMDLLAAAGWDGREVAGQLSALKAPLPDTPAWSEELYRSAQRIASLMQGPPRPEPGQIVPRSAEELPPALVSTPF